MLPRSKWRAKCPQTVHKRLSDLHSRSMSIREHPEPSKFILRCEESNYRVCIGSPHYCSCGKSQPCKHVLFVLLFHFNMSSTNPSIWQGTLSDIELNELLTTVTTRSKTACYYCREEGCLTGCKHCKTIFHWRCALLKSQASNELSTHCPNCSEPVQRSTIQDEKCSGCSSLSSEVVKCLLCPCYFLCMRCHNTGRVHSTHPFSSVIVQRNATKESLSIDVSSLQYREINPEDYEALLHLDVLKGSDVLTLEEFSRFPIHRWSGVDSESSCLICLDDFRQDEPFVSVPCGHFFHEKCALKWLTEHRAECPIDHTKIAPPQLTESTQCASACSREGKTFAAQNSGMLPQIGKRSVRDDT